ncbi:MAG: hypothetical protein PHI49_07370 [Halothiobacillaceae bacterium]|nr:hypothetical protein [Halothiobacillaceae bacterium]
MNAHETIDFDNVYDHIISLIPDEVDVSEIISYDPEINSRRPSNLPPVSDKSGRLAEKYGYSSPAVESIRQDIYKNKAVNLVESFVLNCISRIMRDLSLYCTRIRKGEIRKSTVLNKTIEAMKSSLMEKSHKSGYSAEERKILRKFVNKYSGPCSPQSLM